jgi:hypothetical protein
MPEQVYSFVINSQEKIAGTNNSATYNLMFSILPREYQYYKVGFSLVTDPAFFVDTYDTVSNVNMTYTTGCGHIETTLLLQSSMKTNNSPSNVLGFFTRSTSVQNTTTTNHICYMNADKSINQEIVVLRPDVDQISINIYTGTGSTLLVSTNNNGILQSDMPNYLLIMQFTPVKDFHVS